VDLHLQIHSATARNETEITLLFVSLNFKIIEIMTLVLDSTSEKKLSLLKELALEMGVKVTETPKVELVKLVIIENKAIPKNQLMKDIESSFKQLKQKKDGKITFNSIDTLLNEK